MFTYCCYATALREVPEVCLLQTKNVSGLQKYSRFQNEYNKVEIELRVVQFWTEIKLVITNRTPASRSCDFVITRLISVQIALHSVQLPLLIALFRSAINDFRDGWGEREIKTREIQYGGEIYLVNNKRRRI